MGAGLGLTRFSGGFRSVTIVASSYCGAQPQNGTAQSIICSLNSYFIYLLFIISIDNVSSFNEQE